MTPFQIIEAEMIKRGERIDALEAENAALKARIAELEAERDAWFSTYQNLKERTDNYNFLLYKTREQEKEIYRLVEKINELGG